MKTLNIQIDPKIILYVLLGIFLVWLGINVIEVVLILFFSFILNAAARPSVDKLEARGVPRVVSIVLIYGLVLILLGFMVFIIANEFAHQLQNLITSFPDIYANFAQWVKLNLPALSNLFPLEALQPGVDSWVQQLADNATFQSWLNSGSITDVAQRGLAILGSITSLVVALFTTIMVSIYMLLRKRNVYHGVLDLIPKKQADRFARVIAEIEERLGAWLVGQFFLMVVVGFLTYLIVLIPGFLFPDYTLDSYALPIALMAGLLEGIPNLGPVITMVLASLIALGTGGFGPFVYIAIASVLIQQFEAVFLVPKVMQKAVGLDPIITILSVIGAFKIGGVLAALIVVPVMAVVQIAIIEWAEEAKQK